MKTWTRKTWIGVFAGIVLLAAASVAIVEWRNAPRWTGEILRVNDQLTLDDALAMAEPGSTILLPSGTIPLSSSIEIDIPDLTLASSGARATLQGAGSAPVLSIVADGVRLEHLEIIGESIGVSVEANRCALIDLEVRSTPVSIRLRNARDCLLEDIAIEACQIGVEMESCAASELISGSITNAVDLGIRLTASRGNLIEDWTLASAATAIALESNSVDNVLRDCTVTGSIGAGIELRRSNDNVVVDCTIESSRIGVLLDAVTGSEIRRCSLQGHEVAGIFVQQSLQNRVIETGVEAAETGILLSQSSESTLSSNEIRSCTSGIQLTNSHRNLVSGNLLSACGVGIHTLQADENRLLRNETTDSDAAGFILQSGTGNRVFDSEVFDGDWGIVLSDASETVVLRNAVQGPSLAAVLASAGDGYRILENDLRDAPNGVVLVGAVRSDILENLIEGNTTGLLLVRSGVGVRIEGNTIADNRVGLQAVDDTPAWMQSVTALGLAMPEGENDTIAPVIANNTFLQNETFDLKNDSSTTLLAAGNWWGVEESRTPEDNARVSQGVDLNESAWRGAVAVGTERALPQLLLGRILQYTLSDAGFRVIDLVGIGDREAVLHALERSDVDAIWWGVGSENAVPGAEDVQVESLDLPIEQGWRMIGSTALTQQLPESTLSALAIWLGQNEEFLRFTAPAGFEEDELHAWLHAYGISERIRSFTPTATIEEAEALLKFGAVDVAIVGNLEETLSFAGFGVLSDDLQVVVPLRMHAVIQTATLETVPGVDAILHALAEELTEASVHDLISRVRLLHQSPEDVAREYVSSVAERTE